MAGSLLPILSDVPVGSYGRPLCYEDKGLAVPGRRKVGPSWGDELNHPGSIAANPTLQIFGLNRFYYADRCSFVPKSFICRSDKFSKNVKNKRRVEMQNFIRFARRAASDLKRCPRRESGNCKLLAGCVESATAVRRVSGRSVGVRLFVAGPAGVSRTTSRPALSDAS